MRTLGIDLASQPDRTAACLLEWTESHVTILELRESCHDEDLDDLISNADAIGIDAPLGWPHAFREATARWQETKWNDEIRDQLRFRETDRFVRSLNPKNRPLSVSSDLIALPAMRAMALLKRHAVHDRSGKDGRFFEVYPAATLKAWNLLATGYKKNDQASIDRREEIVHAINEIFPPLKAPIDRLTQNADVLDAWLAALTTRAAALEMTHEPPDPKSAEHAIAEGWIHVPSEIALFQS
ncbi:MAG: DUF429 domain-containing protein [Verrucomicrobiota bacterium]